MIQKSLSNSEKRASSRRKAANASRTPRNFYRDIGHGKNSENAGGSARKSQTMRREHASLLREQGRPTSRTKVMPATWFPCRVHAETNVSNNWRSDRATGIGNGGSDRSHDNEFPFLAKCYRAIFLELVGIPFSFLFLRSYLLLHGKREPEMRFFRNC